MSSQAALRGLSAVFLGGSVFGMAMYTGYVFAAPVNYQKKSELREHERRAIFDKLAGTWEDITYWDEFFGRIKWHRYRLCGQHAYGSVLEVASGTGQNMFNYDKSKVTQLTLLDYSRRMMEKAQRQRREDMDIRFRLGSAEKMKFPDESFDCVVDTFGICSFNNPREALSEMVRVCKTDGHLLLLEHGKSNFFFMQKVLARTRLAQLHKYGCDCNRDMLALVREQGNLVEQSVRRKQFGTLYIMILKKSGVAAAAAQECCHDHAAKE